MIEWLIYLFIGGVAGIAAGLFGLGGGLIVVPALVMVYQWQGVNPDFIMQMAISLSLMTIVVTSLSSAYSHHRYQHINWSVVAHLTPVLLLGAFLGAYCAISVSSHVLQVIFVVYMIIAAIKVWLPAVSGYSSSLLKKPQLRVFGLFAGSMSALMGVGGGTLTVPYLVAAKLPIKHAIGTSSACGFPIALAAVIGFMVIGSALSVGQNTWHTSLIDWKAFIGIVATSMIFARVGARLVDRLPVLLLQRAFSVVLVSVALKMWLELG